MWPKRLDLLQNHGFFVKSSPVLPLFSRSRSGIPFSWNLHYLFIFPYWGKKWRKWRFLLMMDVDMDPWYLIKPDCFYTLALFAEIQAQIFGCFVFRVVVRCFGALLYCFSSFPFLGTCPPVTWFNGNFIINSCFIIFIIIAYFMENGYGGWIVEWTCQIS